MKEVFLAFKPLVENHFQKKIGTLLSDNGGEYIALRSYLQTHDISHLTSPPHTPEHNSLSERKHRHIVETGMSLLSAASVPKSYCPYAFAIAVYLINRLPTPVLANQSPYQKLLGQAPNFEKLRTFGCRCYPWRRPYSAQKLDDRSTPCVFMGYSLTQSAYYCLDILTGRVYTSRHVQFDEFTCPFSSHTDHAKVQQSEEAPSQSSVSFTKVHMVQPLGPHQPVPPTASATTPSQVLPSLNSSSSSSNMSSSLSPTGQPTPPNNLSIPDQPNLTTERPTGPATVPNTQIDTSTSQRPTGQSSAPTISVQQPSTTTKHPSNEN